MREDLFKGLTDEQIERAKACRSHDELLKMAKAEGVELTDEQLAAIDGGMCSSDHAVEIKCPKCHSKNIVKIGNGSYRCEACGTIIAQVTDKLK